jgi:hypothetical protein
VDTTAHDHEHDHEHALPSLAPDAPESEEFGPDELDPDEPATAGPHARPRPADGGTGDDA